MFHLSRCVYLTIVLFLPFWQFFYLVNLTFSYFRGFHFYFLRALISLFLVYINSFPRPDQCFFFIFLVFSASFHRNILELLQKKQGKRVKWTIKVYYFWFFNVLSFLLLGRLCRPTEWVWTKEIIFAPVQASGISVMIKGSSCILKLQQQRKC